MTASTPALQERGDGVRRNLMSFLEQRTKQAIAADVDLFATGLVSSLFALELVIHLEQSFGVTVAGPDLTLDNFRTVDAMTALVLRLGGADGE
jgi:methoxymalonate biosynthesis acyl carrier protein